VEIYFLKYKHYFTPFLGSGTLVSQSGEAKASLPKKNIPLHKIIKLILKK